VAIEGRLQTRQWDDDRGARHWKTEVVATSVEMLSGRRKRDYEADSLAAQAEATGGAPDGAASPARRPKSESRTAADEPAEDAPAEDEQVLVLA